MRLTLLYLSLLIVILSAAQQEEMKAVKKLQIGIKKRVDNCTVKSRRGDTLYMQYRGTLHGTDIEFDSSYSRNQPFIFTIGAGHVIQGWDQGLIGMCEGEERRLLVPAQMAYGSRGAPPKIPPNSALAFEVKLDKLERHGEL